MGRVECITKQHQVLKKPIRIFDEYKIDPLRVVRQQLMSAEISFKHSREVITRFSSDFVANWARSQVSGSHSTINVLVV
jgi:hypothetical protein